jgi:RNA polymerase sigma-B factor
VIAASGPALLRDWELLQHQVVPPLLEVECGRAPRAWSIGSVDDAVAVGVAFQHARSSCPSEGIELYAGEWTDRTREAGFGRADMRRVPSASQAACFVRQDGRWMAGDRIAEQVVLSDPVEPVDLVTVRDVHPDDVTTFESAIAQIREGGQLLIISPDGASLPAVRELEPLDRTSTGWVYRKCAPAGVPGCRRHRHQAGAQPDTLARHRAQEELVASHLRLAKSLARRFEHHGEPSDDLEQVAMLALVKAAKRFDPDRDTRFATYATSSILGELKRHFRDKTWMLRVPRPMQELYLSIKQAADELSQTLGASPSIEEIARHLRTTDDAVCNALGAGENFWPASLDGGQDDEPGREIPVVDGSFDQMLDRIQVQRLMPRLADRERLILKRIYFDNRTQHEVAAELDVSQMQVSRLLARTVARLRA